VTSRDYTKPLGRAYHASRCAKKKTLLTEVSKCRAGQEAQLLPQRKELEGSWGLEELEEILAVTSKSRRLGGRLKATTGKNVFAVVRRGQQIVSLRLDKRKPALDEN